MGENQSSDSSDFDIIRDQIYSQTKNVPAANPNKTEKLAEYGAVEETQDG